MKQRVRVFFIVVMVFLLFGGAGDGAFSKTAPNSSNPSGKVKTTLGVLSPPVVSKTDKVRWGSIAQYLNRQIQTHQFVVRFLDAAELQTLSQGNRKDFPEEIDFLLLDPGTFQKLNDQKQLTGLATLKNRIDAQGKSPLATTETGAVVFIQGDWANVELLTALKDKSLMGNTESEFEWRIVWEEMKRQGVDPYHDLKLSFAGGAPEKVAQAVKAGTVYAGVLSIEHYYNLIRSQEFKKTDFRVLNMKKRNAAFPLVHSTKTYPEKAFAALPHVSTSLQEQVSLALIGMPIHSSEAQAADISGWTVLQDYRSAGQLNDAFEKSKNWNGLDFFIDTVVQNYKAVWLIAILFLGLFTYALWKEGRARRELEILRLDQTSMGKKLEFQAFNDPLTGLPNRRLLQDRLLQTIKLSNRDKRSFCVVMADLDHFKEVNDTLGHDAGDQLIKTVARRLQDTLRESDTICRVGGDEFAFICNDLAGDYALPLIANRLIDVLTEPIVVSGTACTVGVSLGISLYPEHGQDPEILMRKADIAMYKAKEKRNCFAIFDQNTDTRSRDMFVLQNDIRTAISKDQLEVHFQPIINVADKTIVGVETLVRWLHPKKGIIMPDDFIPLARKTGQIKALSQLVLKKAIKAGGEWTAQHDLPLRISVNITSDDLEDSHFSEQVISLLKEYQYPPSYLGLEITEDSLITELEDTIHTINELSAEGVNFYLDDYGTGYSSIAYLKKLPIQALKIDRSFIQALETSENDLTIVKSTIALAHSLGLNIVAEGVENAEILKTLSLLGCHLIQGYYICRPLSESEIVSWLKNPPSGFAIKHPNEMIRVIR